jgi:hypothetical protein
MSSLSDQDNSSNARSSSASGISKFMGIVMSSSVDVFKRTKKLVRRMRNCVPFRFLSNPFLGS